MHTQLLERLAALFCEDGELEPAPGEVPYLGFGRLREAVGA